MSPPEVLTSMSRGWNRDPAAVALGTERTQVSAALWTCSNDVVQELTGDTNGNHIISVQQQPLTAETFYDGRLAYSMRHAPGMISLVRADQTPRAVTRTSFGVLHLYIPDAFLLALTDQAGLQAGGIELVDPANATDAVVRRIGADVLAEMREGRLLSQLRIDNLSQELAIHFVRQWSNLSGGPALGRALDQGKLAPWQEKRAIEFLMSRLADDVSLEELAASVRLSAFHFSRSFKRSTGRSPHRFVMERRVERARELLARSNDSLVQIALACGFAGQSHFTTAFKRHTGATPGAWRATVRG